MIFYRLSTYLHPRFFVLGAFDRLLGDLEDDRVWVIFRYNPCKPERINEMLLSPNEIVGVTDSDSARDNADSMAFPTSIVISLFSFNRSQGLHLKKVFKEGVLFFTQSVIFSPTSITF